jgi:hypothetical protein
MTQVGVLFATLYGVCLLRKPATLTWCLAAAVPFSHTAMFSFERFAVTPFFFGCVLATLRYTHLVLRTPPHARQSAPRLPPVVRTWLIVFVSYSTCVTLLGPWVFAGTPVLTPRGGLGDQLRSNTPLTYTISNVAQLSYLFLGVGLLLYMRREAKQGSRYFDLSIWLGLGLAALSFVAPTFWPGEQIDNIAGTHYDIYGTRLRGTFPEPSVFGTFLTASIGYFASRLGTSVGRSRRWTIAGLVLASAEFALAYSGTALVALGVLSVFGVLTYLRRSLVLRTQAATRLVSLFALTVLGALATTDWARGLVSDKLDSSSFADRSTANSIAMDVFFASRGIGVGLGSNRPSSIFFMLMSCVGVVGTVAFFGVMIGAWRHAARAVWGRPHAWALVGVVLSQIAAKPDLAMPVMWLVLGCCVIADRSDATPASTGKPHERPVGATGRSSLSSHA